MKTVERRIYVDTPEYNIYMRARFPSGSWTKNSFEFDGHRWAYRYSSFDDHGEYHLIWRPDEGADGKPEDGFLPPMPEPEDYCGDHNLGVEMFSREQMQAYALAALERFGAGGGEPVAYMCPTSRAMADGSMEDGPDYLEWADEASDYEKRVGKPLYAHPSPTDLQAEYLRGLEDAAKVADANATDEPYGHAKFRCVNIAEAIRALKGKQ